MTAATTLLVLTAGMHVLTLQDAVNTAVGRQPQLMQAHAETQAAQEAVGVARAPLLPQVLGSAGYNRTTGNFAARPGSIPNVSGFKTGETNWYNTFNYWDFGVTVDQYIWDFGQTTDRWKASKASAVSQAEAEINTRLQVVLTVRDAYFNARATKALVGVAEDNLKSQQLHMTQSEAFVKAGTYPQINLAQAQTNVANAQLQLITAQNNYDVAKVQLNQAMGVLEAPDYEVADEWLTPVQGEDATPETLVAEAGKARPDLASLDDQIRAQELTISSIKGAYWPSIGANASMTEAGSTSLIWNGSVGLSLSWPMFQGYLTRSQVGQARANLISLQAQRDTILLQVRSDVVSAQLQVRAGKTAVLAATQALVNARLQLTLAEERYKQGVGNSVELTDAQSALTSAQAQLVQADYNLSVARAALIKALGRQ